MTGVDQALNYIIFKTVEDNHQLEIEDIKALHLVF